MSRAQWPRLRAGRSAEGLEEVEGAVKLEEEVEDSQVSLPLYISPPPPRG